jgi:hypothetical protein
LDQRTAFWSYLITFAFGVAALISIARPTNVQINRCLIVTDLAAVGTMVMLVESLGGGSLRGLGQSACALWLVSSVYFTLQQWALIASWSPTCFALEQLANESPTVLSPGQFIGVSSNDVSLVRDGLRMMKRLGVNVFRHKDRLDRYKLIADVGLPAKSDPTAVHVQIDSAGIAANGHLRLSGWAVDGRTGRYPGIVLLRVGSRYAETATGPLPRDDVAAALKAPPAAASGWTVTLPADEVATARARGVTVVAVGFDGTWSAVPVSTSY